jgi:IMP dehydrogenase
MSYIYRIIPQYNKSLSRKDADVSSKFCGIDLEVPIVSSPMSSVTEAYMCNSIYRKGGVGIIHRYNSVNFQCKLLGHLYENTPKVAAIGLNENSDYRLQMLSNNGLEIVCIDSINSFSSLMEKKVAKIKEEYPHLKIIASNCSSIDCYKFFLDLEVDGIRFGFGNGSCSTTNEVTSHFAESKDLLYDIKKLKIKNEKVTHIADGNHKTYGDIVASIALGADAVCLGNMIAGVKETPSKYIIEEDGKRYKKVLGNASKLNQTIYRGMYSSEEGKDINVKTGSTLQKIIHEIKNSLQTAITYSGQTCIKDFQKNSKIERVKI